MPGKTRKCLREKTLYNVMRSNLSVTDKNCIKEVFDRFEKLKTVKVKNTINPYDKEIIKNKLSLVTMHVVTMSDMMYSVYKVADIEKVFGI